MNREFLGDAQDWWKGGLLRLLTQRGLLANLQVDPRLTDPAAWRSADWALYSDLLGLPTADVRGTGEGTAGHDLFLDPDTGVRTGRVAEEAKYVTPEQVISLLATEPQRVVAIYQYVRRPPVRSRMEQVVAAFRARADDLCYCSSESRSGVAMLFVSKACDRILAIHSLFVGFYRRKARERTALWRCA